MAKKKEDTGPIKTVRVRATIVADDEKTRNEHWKLIRDWSLAAGDLYNIAVSLAVQANHTLQKGRIYPTVRTQFPIREDEDRDKYNKRIRKIVNKRHAEQVATINSTMLTASGKPESDGTHAYRALRAAHPEVHSGIVSKIYREAEKRVNADAFGIVRGEKSIPSYRAHPPLPMNTPPRLKCMKDENGNSEWYLTNFSRGIKMKLIFGRKNQGAEEIITRIAGALQTIKEAEARAKDIIDKDEREKFLEEARNIDFKPGTTKVQLVKGKNGKRNTLNVIIPYHYSPDKSVELDPNKTLGVDLGINVPIVVAPSTGRGRVYIGSKREARDYRLGIQRKIWQIQKDMRSMKGGRGYKKRARRLLAMKQREKNYVENLNHNYSSRVIQAAIMYRCGQINLEKLTGIGDRTSTSILRNWSYFQLQEMIRYKAKGAGITVNNINPAYTSQKCAECGEKGYRKSIEFRCANPECKMHGKTVHADLNAAKNIARSTDIIEDKKDSFENTETESA